jgi:hypothetical protein
VSDPRREAVWLALSELWLDTELDAGDLLRLAHGLHESGYPQAELEAIYAMEVAPAVWLNAWSVAGVWQGFDPDWLFERCRRNQARRARLGYRLGCRLLRGAMTGVTRADWNGVIHRLEGLGEG